MLASSKISRLRQVTVLLCLAVLSAVTALGQQPDIRDSVDKDYSDELPRVPPRSPDEALASFEVLDGFEISLIASEPLVVDPIAFAYDARERLFVVEMRGYSEQEDENLGRVALLQDTDGDGCMDRRTTYVEGLSWPTALWPWKDGVLVAHPPRLTWFRDTDDDGVSDKSEDWLVGFGRDNVQGMINSLRWGIDCTIHGAVSSTGAELQQVAAGINDKLILRRRDFALDPLNKTVHPTSGGGQHGLCFNRWGDKFVTSNSDHLQQVIDLDSWVAQHPSKVQLPELRKSIAEDGPQAEVFRASPIEPWRIVRTRLRATGVVPGIVEGGGRPAGYFTGATGTWIMDSGVGFGDPGSDTALVCDVGSNLVHRKRLVDQGLFWTGQRLDEANELLRSRDIWFRPVQLGDAPDGALIIADMCREVIEHPKSLPPMIKQHLDLTSGRDRGRIWRLVPASQPTSPDNQTPDTGSSSRQRLADLSPSELVTELQSPIAWRRRMASQLLLEDGTRTHAAAIIDMALGATAAEVQVLAMHVADRLGALEVEHVRELLDSSHARIVAAALGSAREHAWGESLAGSLQTLAQRPEPRVQLELAALCADLDPSRSLEILRAMLPTVHEPLVRSVLAIAAGDRSWELIADTGKHQMPAVELGRWLALLLPVWAETLPENPALRSWVNQQLRDAGSPSHSVWLDSVSRLASGRQVGRLLNCLSESELQKLTVTIEKALEKGTDPQWVRLLDGERQQVWISRFLKPTQGDMMLRAAIKTIELLNDRGLDQTLLTAFPSLTPTLQDQALRVLIQSIDSTQALLTAVGAGKVKPSQIPPDLRQQILSSKDASLASRARSLLGQASPDRLAVIEQYASAYDSWQRDELNPVDLHTARGNGRQQFERVCGQCHRVDGIGHDVGAALTQLSTKSPRQLMEAILDPNREVDPRYSGYSILLVDGRVMTGIIREETAGQIVMVAAGGEVLSVNRSDIEEIKSTGLSLMPTGIEEQLSPQQVAEVIVFLQALGNE